MQYVITFLEGIISFLSPCMLPMLPIYISYFACNANPNTGNSNDFADEGNTSEHTPQKLSVLSRALSFVLGFTLVFTGLGLFAGTLSGFFIRHQQILQIGCGLIVIAFGLSYLNVFHLSFFKGIAKTVSIRGLFSAFVFGMIYSVSLTPCVGAFLGSALMLATTSGGARSGALLLLTYSLGLGIPFLISAILIDRLNMVFTFVKRHYNIINFLSGVFLIITGIFMMFGILNKILAFFS